MSYSKTSVSTLAYTVVMRDEDGDVEGRVITSTATTGTPPLVVASTTEVANLNASRVGGYLPATSGASKLLVTGAAGTVADSAIATGVPTAGMVPTIQVDGSKTWQTPSGSSGGDGAGMFEVIHSGWANGVKKQLYVGPSSKILSQIQVYAAGASNVTDATWDFDLADEANYTQQDATAGTDFDALGFARLHRTFTDTTVKLLLRGNGVNASTAIYDESSVGRTVTLVGNVSISTTTPKYGIGCIDLDGSGDEIHLDMTSDLTNNWHDYSFSVETWVRFDSVSGTQFIFASENATFNIAFPGFVVFLSGSTMVVTASTNGSAGNIWSSTTVQAGIATGTWYHVAFSYNAIDDTLRVFLDGTLKVSTTSATLYTGKYLSIGGASGNYLNGQIKDFRASIDAPANAPRYIATFTAPGEITDPSCPINTPYYVYTGKLRSFQAISQLVSLALTGIQPTNTTLKCLYSLSESSGVPVWKSAADATVLLSDALSNWSTLTAMQTKFTTYIPGGSDAFWRLAFGFETTDPTVSPSMTLISFVYNEVGAYNTLLGSTFTISNFPSATAGMVEATNVSAGTVQAKIVAAVSV